MDVVFFVREIIETNPKLRESIMARLLDTFYQIRSSRVCSCALWIVGEYCHSLADVEQGIGTIKQSMGELPFYVAAEEALEAGTESKAPGASPGLTAVPGPITSSKRPAVLADGTYATQSAAAEVTLAPTVVAGAGATANLRALLLTGDFFLGAVVATSLTKLVLRLEELQSDKTAVNGVSGVATERAWQGGG